MPTRPFLLSVMPRRNAITIYELGENAYLQVGHSLLSLGAAAIGGLLSLVLFGGSATRPREVVAEPQRRNPSPRRRRRTVLVGPTGVVVVLAVALAGLRWAPGPSAAVAFLVTWSLLVLAVVGALFGPRGRRASWFAAALFGMGYLGLIFHLPTQPNWPHAATDRLLSAVREWFPWVVREAPPVPGGTAAANARILDALDRPVALHFPNEVTLETVLKTIRDATRGPNDAGIPIYVDPLSLQEAEKTMQSTVTIDLQGVPLRTTLHLLLKQLGMTYGVGSGLLIITSAESDDPFPNWLNLPSIDQDPFLVVGHCLLALVAAGLGGLLAPRVCKA